MSMATRETEGGVGPRGVGRWAVGALAWVVVAGQAAAVLGQGDVPAAGPKGSEPLQSWLVRNGIGLLILGMSFYLVALVVWMYREYRRKVVMPDRLREAVERLIDEQREVEVHGLLRREESFLGRVLREGVGRLPAGMPAAQRAMELANDKAAMEMEHRTTYLATVGTLGPMLGLLGTVYGMILSFGVIGRAGDAPQASDLAAGISTALVATLEGIAVSVPAIAFYAFFRNRISRLALDVQIEAESLLERLAPGLRTVHPLAAAVVRGGGPGEPRRAALPARDELVEE